MTMATMTVRFLVEMIGLAAFAYWGYQTPTDGLARLLLTVVPPLTFITVWATLVAPKATNSLSQPQRDNIGTGLLLVAAGALALAGQPVMAVAFAAVVMVDAVLMIVLGPTAVEAIRPTAARGRQIGG
jgi:hypothetical protein